MTSVLVTLAVPPFDYRSPWWWCMDRLSPEVPLELVAPSGVHQFQKEEKQAGTVHRLNVFADPESPWDEREHVEFAVKCYVYLSKLAQREAFDRIVVADCDGIEPLLAAHLSVLGPVWVRDPDDFPSRRGQLGRPLLEVAERVFVPGDLLEEAFEPAWPPEAPRWERLFRRLFGGGGRA